jgi:hypothetical protein
MFRQIRCAKVCIVTIGSRVSEATICSKVKLNGAEARGGRQL